MSKNEFIEKFNSPDTGLGTQWEMLKNIPAGVTVKNYTQDTSTGDVLEVPMDWEPQHRDFLYPRMVAE